MKNIDREISLSLLFPGEQPGNIFIRLPEGSGNCLSISLTELFFSFKNSQETYSFGTNMVVSVEVKRCWGLMSWIAGGVSVMEFLDLLNIP